MYNKNRIDKLRNTMAIGIITMNKPSRLKRTLESYDYFFKNGFEVHIHIDCSNEHELAIAKEYVPEERISFGENVGISEGFLKICRRTKKLQILLLENDFQLVETDDNVITERLMDGYHMEPAPGFSANVIRYRHQKEPGEPLYTRQFQNREMDKPTHLLDAVHWRTDLHQQFPQYVQAAFGKGSDEVYWRTTAMNANFTNNPCLYYTKWYIVTVTPFSGPGVALEGNIQGWWEKRNNIYVAQGPGLFKHDG